MTKKSQYYIFGDQSWPVESLAKALPAELPVSTWIDGKGWVSRRGANSKAELPPSKNRQQPVVRALLAAQHCELPSQQLEAVAIVGFQNSEISRKVVEILRTRRAGFKILEVGAHAGVAAPLLEAKRSVAWHKIMSAGMEQEINLLSLQHRVQELRNCLKDAPEVAILLQDDPDPDGLASALALRKILNRNAQTAPIVTFGKITRPENVAMSKLLGIEVETVDSAKISSYARVALVDCQPSFFKGRRLRADVVLDHHPKPPFGNESADLPSLPLFEEVREELGAMSTLLTQFLRAAGIEVSQRLATALLYGIKSDTLLLSREVSELDLEAFMYLYPRINGNVLRRIERPELPIAYLDKLRAGLRYLEHEDGIVVLPLGRIEREEWIPQGADFALQIEGAQWALSCGIVDDNIVISGRNCGYVQHCGDLFKALFDGLGRAGGHRTMAKGIIPRRAWIKKFGSSTLRQPQMGRVLADLIAMNVKPIS